MMRKIHLDTPATPPLRGAGTWPGEHTDPRHVEAPIEIRQRKEVVEQSSFILVIDDSATVRKILETCLGREGFQAKSCNDGVEALKWLMEPEALVPDLIVLDIELPRMDGFQVARRLKRMPRFEKTVIMMLSRRDGVIDRLKSRCAGAQGYITKPLKTQEVVAVTQAYLGVPARTDAPRGSAP